jgi:hypothetical protein
MIILLQLKRNYIVLYVKEYWLVIKRRRLMAKQQIMRRRRLQSLIKKNIKIKCSLEKSNSKNKRMMERKRTAMRMNYLKKEQSHPAPGITKEKGMHDSKDEVQVIEGTPEKKAVVGGKWILRSL